MAAQVKKTSFSDIISVDPLSLASYKYTKNEILPHALGKSSQSSFFISYILTKDIISTIIEISRNIPESDLQDAIEIKVYEELGLDSSINYKITFNPIETNDTKNQSFNIFVIDVALLENQFSNITKNTRYIDFVTTAPFSLASLYKKAIISNESVDCFIYFQKNDAFLAIYGNGEYLYSKSLNYSLTQITEKFCELIGERIDENTFYNLLITEGLKSTNAKYQSYLMQLFGELFLHINDVLIFAKRSYNIGQIDRIYIGSEIGIFIGINEYAKSYLGLESHEFNFSIAINSKEWYVDQMHILMALSAQIYLEEKDDKLNFSLFKRPLPLTQRPIGKLLGVIAASFIISFAYPAYQFGYTQFLQLQLNNQTQKFQELSKSNNAIKTQLASLKADKDKVTKILNQEAEKLEFRNKLITEIHKKKTEYAMKGSLIVSLIEILNKHDAKVSQITFKNNDLVLFVQNKDEKKITEFIQDLTQLGLYKITTDKIEKNDEKKVYLSQITIGLQS
ncbi:MAG: hypothetical protein IBX44_01240 [Sulfurospirillum sp.]|nr:hypothetical protein [Sulfurospirillum sp.]